MEAEGFNVGGSRGCGFPTCHAAEEHALEVVPHLLRGCPLAAGAQHVVDDADILHIEQLRVMKTW